MKVGSIFAFGSTLLAALASGPWSPVSDAAAAATAEPDREHAQVALITEHTSLVPGATAYLGVHFKLDPHWHVYWNGRSDSGGPIEIELTLPAGYSAEPTLWPAPKRLISEGDILDHVYEDEVTLIIPVRVPAGATGSANISGKVTYVICNTACVFENAKLSLDIPLAPKAAKPELGKHAKLFGATRARLPKPLPTGDSAPTIKREQHTAVISAPGATALAFYPAADCIGLVDLTKTGSANQPRLTLKLDPESESSLSVSGILEARYPDPRGTVWYTIGPIAAPQSPAVQKPVPPK